MLLAHGLFLGSQVGSASPPEITAFVLPSLSDESIAITTLTWSADATHVQTTESTTPPAVDDPNWVAVGAPPTVHNTASAGSVTVYAWAKGAGGVSAGVSATCAMVVPSLAAWWEPGLGMTVTEASVNSPNDFSTWTNEGIGTLTPNQPGPFGLNDASLWLENGASAIHRYYQPAGGITNEVAGPAIQRYYVAPVNRYAWIGFGADACTIKYDLVNGLAAQWGVDFGQVGSISGLLQNGFRQIAAYAPNPGPQANVCTLANYAAPTSSHVGDITKGIVVAHAEYIQHRASALADQSPNAYNLAQATNGSQAFVQKTDGSSPGGNTFTGKACIWQPNDVAKTLTNSDAGLLTVMGGAWTYVARVKRLAALTAACPMLATAGGVAQSCGIDTSNRLYVTCGTTATSTATVDTTSEHTVAFAFNPATNKAYAWLDGVAVIDAVDLTPGGAISPTSVTKTVRSFAELASGISSTVASTAQMLAVHNAL